MNEQFTTVLRSWGRDNRRDLPWVGIKDPYRIWLSEVILQQTRVEQGRPYYERFVEAYPTVFDLASAPDDEVMKLWEGLGYYSRARNLLKAARMVVSEMNGVFPASREELRKLPGIGDYTSAAIASFAFAEAVAVVDGNVYRLLSRFFGVDQPIDTPAGKRMFAELAQEVLDRDDPGAHNQAIMDFGSRACRPRNPECELCPLESHCIARAENRVGLLPFKSRRQSRRTRWFHYLILEAGDHILVRQRTEKDIWQGLYDFPAIESGEAMNRQEVMDSGLLQELIGGAEIEIVDWSGVYRQALSHQDIRGVFVRFRLVSSAANRLGEPSGSGLRLVSREVIPNLAFPRLIRRYWEEPVLS